MELYKDPFFLQLKGTLEKLQKSEAGFYGWSATVSRSRSFQNLLIGTETGSMESYQDRDVEDLSYSIQVYLRHGEPTVMGQTGLTIDPMTPLEEQIRSALRSAAMIENPSWDLPLPPSEPYREVETFDPILMKDPQKARISFLAELNEEVQKLEGVQLNSAEFYLNLTWNCIETSTGIKMLEDRTDLYFEAAMEKKPLPNTQEVHRYKKGVTLKEMDLPGFLTSMREETLSLDNTELPPTTDDATILVDGEVVSDFINALVSQLNAASEYNRSPIILPGNRVEEGELLTGAEPLNLRMDPFVPGMVESRPFTHEGLPAKAADVVQDGIVREQIVSHRMGSYLDRSANPVAGNFLIPPGRATKKELLASVPTCLEILSFSSLLINPRTLTWSSEIKLGKLYSSDGSVRMVKSGVASGSIRRHLAAARFSSETIVRNAVADSWHPSIGYNGPAFMLIGAGVKIAGA